MAKHGLNALNLTMDYDEMHVLSENLTYLTSTLDLEGLTLKLSSDPSADDKIQEQCCPGKPFIQYRTEVRRPDKAVLNTVFFCRFFFLRKSFCLIVKKTL